MQHIQLLVTISFKLYPNLHLLTNLLSVADICGDNLGCYCNVVLTF